MSARAAARSEEALPEADRLLDLPHPREVFDLHGHEVGEAAILRALGSGQVPHAWLIGGPQGIGKATLAYRFARAVLKTGDAPRESLATAPDDPVARQVAALSHPNLIVLRRTYDEKAKRLRTALTVDEVRRLHGMFAHHASDGGWRVAIVDSADDMNRNAANALLKILEEPPARALIILLAHRPARLLPTIRSRCRRLTLNPLDETAMTAVLKARCGALPEDKRAMAIRLGDGSAGRALSFAMGEGLSLYEDLSGLMARLPEPDAAALHAFAAKAGGRIGDGQFETTADLLDIVMGRIIRCAATGRTPPDILPGDGEAALRLAGRGGLERWIEAWDKIAASLAEGAALNLDRKHLLLTAFFTLQSVARSA